MSAAGAKILVVEDEAAMRLALSGLLKKEGYEVTLASSAPQGLAALEEGAFDLVLTDLNLGKGGSGLDVLQASRRAREEAPVIVITAHGSERAAVEAMQKGASHYVPKPFDNDELRLVVARELDRASRASTACSSSASPATRGSARWSDRGRRCGASSTRSPASPRRTSAS